MQPTRINNEQKRSCSTANSCTKPAGLCPCITMTTKYTRTDQQNKTRTRILCLLHTRSQYHSWHRHATDCGSVIKKWNLLSLEKSDKRKHLLIECSHFGGIRFNLCTTGDKLFKKFTEITNKRESHHFLDGTIFISVIKHTAEQLRINTHYLLQVQICSWLQVSLCPTNAKNTALLD